MPSTYSTNLRIQLMATGENSGTWGTITNTNLGTLIEQSIVGSATQAMADANQTLTIPDGATGSGRCVFITCTGALTAGRNLTVPTINKNYIVENATTGGFDITVKTSAGTGIAVKPGTKRFVFADSTNVTEAISGTGALTVSGALTATTVNGLTVTDSTGTLTIANGKTLTASNTLTLAGTDAATINFNTYLPVGVVMPYAGAAAPATWLLCDGSAVNRTTYADLFAVISTTFGSGDGSTTFNLPDMRGRVPAGRDNMGGSAASRLTSTVMTPNGTTVGATGGTQTHTLTDAEMPGHTHASATGAAFLVANAPAFFSNLDGAGGNFAGTQNFTNNAGGDDPHLNTQPTMIFNYIIRAGA